MIYFFQNTKTQLIKIGTTSNVPIRQRNIQREEGSPICVLGVMEGGYPLEGILHKCFSAEKTKGEWFNPAEGILSYIAENCTAYDVEPHNGPNGYQLREGRWETNSPGRPPISLYPKQMVVRLSIEHHQHILTRAAALNISAAEYLRRLIEQDMEQPPGRPSKP